MDMKLLSTLRAGDTVRIHFTHPGATPRSPRGRPFDVVIAKVNGTGKAYQEDDGRYYESLQIQWSWRDMPIELQPDECVRDDIRGLDSCHVDHIVEIINRAPYRSQSKPRNFLYAYEQEFFLDRQKIEAYRLANGEQEHYFGRRRGTATGVVFEAYNETYNRNIRQSQYNGHVFKFAEALIARRPMLAIAGHLDSERFYDAWNGAGRPGYIGPFKGRVTHSHFDIEDDVSVEHVPYKALLNRKAFTKWVVRNATRFVMTKAQKMKNMIQAAVDEEEYMRQSMEEEFRSGY